MHRLLRHLVKGSARWAAVERHRVARASQPPSRRAYRPLIACITKTEARHRLTGRVADKEQSAARLQASSESNAMIAERTRGRRCALRTPPPGKHHVTCGQ